MPAFIMRCNDSKEVQLVGAESVKAFEVAFRKVGNCSAVVLDLRSASYSELANRQHAG